MLHSLHLIVLLIYPLIPNATLEPHYNQRLTSTSQGISSISAAAATATTNFQSMQNNWIILHASPTQSHHYPFNRFNYSSSYQQHKFVPAKEVKVIEPYVLEISKVPEATNAFFTARRKHPVPLSNLNNKYRRNIQFDVVPEKIEKLPTTTTTDIDKDIAKDVLHISKMAAAAAAAAPTLTSVNVGTSDSTAEDEAEVEQSVSDFLVPLENAVDKVRYFCDLVKNVISSDVDADEDSMPTTLTSALPNDNEVQGRGYAASTIKARSTTTAGTGRKTKKLKKKFKKFLLPLLLAYKLKFLTLIPVLIGGLTLLVGSTGLAGFFFALFTAVMSLKSSVGAKTVVVKKI